MLENPKIDIVLGVDFFKQRKALEGRCGKIIFTGPIDR
jgi:UDP-galactopyranose mutase